VYKFDQILIFIVKNHVYNYKHCDDVCNDVILMPQYILGVVDNVIYCFVANLTDFTAVKEL